VELLRRYSNRDESLKSLVRVIESIRDDAPSEPGPDQLVSADGSGFRPWQVTERLGGSSIESMIKAYLNGSTIAELAELHTISPSSVKRLLREHGARKHRLKNAC
jgi:aminoglycoside phosphotransferase (APT) family kinase protein